MTKSSQPSFSETLGKALAKAMAKLERSGHKAPAMRSVAPPPPHLNKAASAGEKVWRYARVLNIDGQPRVCAFWATTWKGADGQNWTRKFSVNFWGEDVAEQKAREVFAQWQRLMRKRGR